VFGDSLVSPKYTKHPKFAKFSHYGATGRFLWRVALFLAGTIINKIDDLKTMMTFRCRVIGGRFLLKTHVKREGTKAVLTLRKNCGKCFQL